MNEPLIRMRNLVAIFGICFSSGNLWAMDTIQCTQTQMLAPSDPRVVRNAQIITDGYNSKSFSFQKAGYVEGSEVFSLTDAKYGKLPYFYTVAIEGNTIHLLSHQAFSFSERERKVTMSTSTSGIAILRQAGLAGYGGGSWEEYELFNCIVR